MNWIEHNPMSRRDTAPASHEVHPPDPFTDKRMVEFIRAVVVDRRSRLLTKCSTATVHKALGSVKVIFRETVYRDDIIRDPTARVDRINMSFPILIHHSQFKSSLWCRPRYSQI